MKKFISFLLCLIISVSSVIGVAGAYTPAELDEDNLSVTQHIEKDNTYTLGDIDNDGKVNSIDSYTIKAALAGTVKVDYVVAAGDFDANGSLTSADSFYLKKCLAGSSSISEFETSQLQHLTIGGYDIEEFSIVIEEDCLYEENEYMAAELLFEYIPIATGYDIQIVRGEKNTEHGIYIHDVDKTSELGTALGNEGYKYEVVDGNLHIYGTDRGNMYATYEILEDYLGFGFVDQLWTFLYKQRSVDITEGTSKTFVPGYRFRQSKSTFNSNEGYRERFLLARGINASIGFSYDKANIPASYYGNFVGASYIDIHSFNYYHQIATGTMPDESYGDLESRYYAKLQSGEYVDETTWEPCATSETEYNNLFTGLLDYIGFVTEAKGIPFLYEDGTHCFSFSPCDNQNWCSCRNCAKKARTTSYVDIYLELKNRGAEDIQKYYPGLKLYTLMYEKKCPVEVVPSEHLILVLGGTSCSNHSLGTDDECCGNGFYGMSKDEFEVFVDDMSALCAKTGAELWMWYYPETNNWWIYDMPNIFTIYYEVTWLFDHGITGFYYEGHNLHKGYNLEYLKAYMFTEVSFNPDMSLEEYTDILKDYLYKVYGHGWENIWEFILMYEEAGDAVGFENGSTTPYCFVGNYDRAFDLVSFEYIRDNYEHMRGLILAAIDELDNTGDTGYDLRYSKLTTLLCTFDLLGLGATYVSSYLEGDEASKALYEERYRWVYDYYYESGMNYHIYVNLGTSRPATFNLDTNPFLQFTAGSVRPHITALLKGE